jgi:glycosyltransferase involved in cell wall biosynthesis
MAEPLRKNSLLKNIYLNLIEKRNLKKSAAIHFTAETEKEEYIKSGLPLSKPIVIPNGFEEGNALGQKDNYSLKKKFNIEFHKKIILFLSRLSWKKGLDTLIPAFGQVLENEPDAILVIGGGDDEGYGKEIVKMVNDLNLKNSVYFIGAVNPKERISLFKECDVFVLSSYAENFGIVVLEAIDGNLPVIITEGVGISKEIRNNEAGIVVKKDEKELREAILWVLNNREESRKMVLNGKKMIVKYFYWPEIAKKFLKEYNELIKKKQL